MTTKDFKHLIGKEIWVIPSNNFIRRGVPLIEQIKSTELLKVGRTNLTTKLGNYECNGGCDRHNYGYLHFISLQEAKEYLLSIDLQQEISRMVQFRNPKFTYQQLLKVKEILTNDNTI